jgi:hypothetical protein
MPRAVRFLLPALVCAALALPASAAASLPTLTASVNLSQPGPPVPRSFLGLSFEAKALPQLAHYGDEGNMVNLLRSLGPGMIRFGGVTVDTQTAWASSSHPKPNWAVNTITADDLAGIDRLAREAHWGVLLGVNLGHYDPGAAADEVTKAQAIMRTTLAGVEIGNEPDGYVLMHLRADPYTFDDYRQQLDSYLQAIGASFPLVGPDVSTPKRASWISGLAQDERPTILSGHYYPLSECHGYLPVVGDLLTRGIRSAEKRNLDRLAAISNSTGLPMRVGETNNISCGGEPDVSDTFASALWAVDYMAQAMRDGIAGINFHDIVSNCTGYGALCAQDSDALAAGRLTAQPEWYALLLARQLLGDSPLPARLGPGRPNVTVSAFRRPGGGLHVVVVDDQAPGSKPIRIKLALPKAFRRGTVLRLTAPAPDAKVGVRLGGVRVASDGTFRLPRRLPRLSGGAGTLNLVVTPSSAALVTVQRRG